MVSFESCSQYTNTVFVTISTLHMVCGLANPFVIWFGSADMGLAWSCKSREQSRNERKPPRTSVGLEKGSVVKIRELKFFGFKSMSQSKLASHFTFLQSQTLFNRRTKFGRLPIYRHIHVSICPN